VSGRPSSVTMVRTVECMVPPRVYRVRTAGVHRASRAAGPTPNRGRYHAAVEVSMRHLLRLACTAAPALGTP
jgi:hypothetical protein